MLFLVCMIVYKRLCVFQEAIKEKQEGDWVACVTNLLSIAEVVRRDTKLRHVINHGLETVAERMLWRGYHAVFVKRDETSNLRDNMDETFYAHNVQNVLID